MQSVKFSEVKIALFHRKPLDFLENRTPFPVNPKIDPLPPLNQKLIPFHWHALIPRSPSIARGTHRCTRPPTPPLHAGCPDLAPRRISRARLRSPASDSPIPFIEDNSKLLMQGSGGWRPMVHQHKTSPLPVVGGSRATPFARSSILFSLFNFVRFLSISFGISSISADLS
jgi:hypothetical protein